MVLKDEKLFENCCNRKSRRKPDRFALSKQYMVVTLLLYSSLQALLALGLIMYAWPSFWPEIYRALHARTSSFSILTLQLDLSFWYF